MIADLPGTLAKLARPRSWRRRSGCKVRIVVVHKVDRFTGSLSDFAKLIEVFEQYAVSFVSVT